MSKFSERFRQLKDEKNATLKDLSDTLNITIPNLSYYMKGREPNYDTLAKIADCFNVTTDWLIGRTDVRNVESSDTVNEIECRLKVKDNEKLTGNKLELYFDIQNIIFDILGEVYLFYMMNDEEYCTSFKQKFRIPFIVIIRNIAEYIKIFTTKKFSKNTILNFMQNTELISSIIQPIMLYNSYVYAKYLAGFEGFAKKDKELLQGIIDFTTKKFSERYPYEKIEEMIRQMDELI